MQKLSFFKTRVGLFLLGGFLATLLPSPMDGLHFWLQKYLFEHSATISKSMFTFWQIIDWYILSAIWWLILIIIAYTLHIRKISVIKSIVTVATILGVGALISIITRFLI